MRVQAGGQEMKPRVPNQTVGQVRPALHRPSYVRKTGTEIEAPIVDRSTK